MWYYFEMQKMKMLCRLLSKLSNMIIFSNTTPMTIFCQKTAVEFFQLSQSEIDDYIASKDCFDKAGGYGIQTNGCVLVKCIEGDYFNVVGLPVAETVRALKEIQNG